MVATVEQFQTIAGPGVPERELFEAGVANKVHLYEADLAQNCHQQIETTSRLNLWGYR